MFWSQDTKQCSQTGSRVELKFSHRPIGYETQLLTSPAYSLALTFQDQSIVLNPAKTHTPSHCNLWPELLRFNTRNISWTNLEFQSYATVLLCGVFNYWRQNFRIVVHRHFVQFQVYPTLPQILPYLKRATYSEGRLYLQSSFSILFTASFLTVPSCPTYSTLLYIPQLKISISSFRLPIPSININTLSYSFLLNLP